jgi:hypothetical protein
MPHYNTPLTQVPPEQMAIRNVEEEFSYVIEPVEPLIAHANVAIVAAAEAENDQGINEATDENREVADDLLQVAAQGEDLDPALTIQFWASMGSVAVAEDLKYTTDVSIHREYVATPPENYPSDFEVNENRRREIAKRARVYSIDALGELDGGLGDHASAPVETVIEAALVVVDTINKLEGHRILRPVNHPKYRPSFALNVASEALRDSGYPDKPLRVLQTFRRFPDQQHLLANAARIALAEDSFDPLLAAAEEVEREFVFAA